jgi:hypothetical protein
VGRGHGMAPRCTPVRLAVPPGLPPRVAGVGARVRPCRCPPAVWPRRSAEKRRGLAGTQQERVAPTPTVNPKTHARIHTYGDGGSAHSRMWQIALYRSPADDLTHPSLIRLEALATDKFSNEQIPTLQVDGSRRLGERGPSRRRRARGRSCLRLGEHRPSRSRGAPTPSWPSRRRGTRPRSRGLQGRAGWPPPPPRKPLEAPPLASTPAPSAICRGVGLGRLGGAGTKGSSRSVSCIT